MPINSGVTIAYDANTWFWHDGSIHNVPEPTYIWKDGGARNYPEPQNFDWVGRKQAPPPFYDPNYDYANIHADINAKESDQAFKKIITQGDKVTIFPTETPVQIGLANDNPIISIPMPNQPHSDPTLPHGTPITSPPPISLPAPTISSSTLYIWSDGTSHSEPEPKKIFPAPTSQTGTGVGVTASGMTQGSNNANYDFIALLNTLGFNQTKPLTPSTIQTVSTGGQGTPATSEIQTPNGFNLTNINPLYIFGAIVVLILIVRK